MNRLRAAAIFRRWARALPASERRSLHRLARMSADRMRDHAAEVLRWSVAELATAVQWARLAAWQCWLDREPAKRLVAVGLADVAAPVRAAAVFAAAAVVCCSVDSAPGARAETPRR